MTDPASFRAGAEAMRARIIAGIRRWWGDARRSAGHRWPGHPHWLEVAVARLDVEELTEGTNDQEEAINRCPQPATQAYSGESGSAHS